MTPTIEAVAAALDARARRARTMAAAHEASAALLEFFARLTEWQRELLPRVAPALRESAAATAPLAARLDTDAIAAFVPELLAWLPGAAPGPLAAAARELAAGGLDWRARLAAAGGDLDSEGDDAVTAFVCEAVTQPVAELAAHIWAALSPSARLLGESSLVTASSTVAGATGPPERCPCCQGLPVAGVLRERGHGAGRALVCGRCLTEWAAPRMMCPACGGLEVAALPVFRDERWPAVRLDACERCHAYLKSVDLTIDGQAIVVVDDLASVPLDLWAVEHGFHKQRPNLLRL